MKRNFVTLGLFSLALAACSGGENGIDGKDGKDGDSCIITNNEDGTATITCPDGNTFTVKNGEKGQKGDAGSDGEKGESCHVTDNSDGSATITCPDGSSFTIKNGENGQKGDAGSDGSNGESCKIVKNSDGSSAVVCQYDGSSYRLVDGKDGQSCYQVENIDGSLAVVCPYDGSSYIVRGNPNHYENYCAEGFWGKNCENECNCNEHQDCNDGVTGDGSCTCKNLWIGQDCNQCDLTKAYGFNCTPYGGVADQDGNTYKTVTIGEQTWMAENLKATKDINGNTVTCYANTAKDADFVENYGCLYTWDDAMKVCPAGWKLPEQKDFKQLLTATGADSDSSSIRASSLANGSDSSGFGALPAGFRYSSGSFGYFGSGAFFWSATTNDSDNAYHLYVLSGSARMDDSGVNDGYSVRCLRDSN